MRKKATSAIVLAVCVFGCGSLFYYYSFYGKEQPVENNQVKYNLASTEDMKLTSAEEKKYYARIPEESPDQVIIGNQKTGEEKTIQIKDELEIANAVMEVTWIDGNQLGVISHVNPSLSYFCVYDVQKQEFILQKYGMDFQWTGDDIRSLVYFVPTEHFNQKKGNEEIRNQDDQVLFRSEEQTELSQLLLSPDGKQIAFIQHNIAEEQWQLSVMQYGKNKVQSRKLDTEPKIIRWDSATELIVDQNHFQVTEKGLETLS